MSLFPLPWYYLGGTICLLSPPKTNEDIDIWRARRDLLSRMDALPDTERQSVLAGDADSDGKTLFDHIGEVLQARGLPKTFPWDPAALDGLKAVVAKMKKGPSPSADLSDEFVLAHGTATSATLYIPWRHPVGQSDVPDFDETVLDDPHVKIHTVLDAVDWSVDCNSANFPGDPKDEIVRVAREEVSRARTYDLGDVEIVPTPTLGKSETRVTFDAADGWTVEVGTKVDTTKDADLMPRHPCGALDGGTRDCPS